MGFFDSDSDSNSTTNLTDQKLLQEQGIGPNISGDIARNSVAAASLSDTPILSDSGNARVATGGSTVISGIHGASTINTFQLDPTVADVIINLTDKLVSVGDGVVAGAASFDGPTPTGGGSDIFGNAIDDAIIDVASRAVDDDGGVTVPTIGVTTLVVLAVVGYYLGKL